MGHALNITLQDILCRYQRQQGKTFSGFREPTTPVSPPRTLLSVSSRLKARPVTISVVRNSSSASGNGRKKKGGHILKQIRRMGASVDWDRECFTFDDQRAKAVRKVFVQLYEEGLIYKGNYIINWCNRCHTALADDEVEHSPTGTFYNIKYKLSDGSGELIIATTRPETMLGDTAICVNPEDDRFKHLIGKTAILPIVGRELPIIGDSYVDMEFGTGA